MTLSSSAALFCAMTILAAIPSISVLAVSTRSAAFGFILSHWATKKLLYSIWDFFQLFSIFLEYLSLIPRLLLQLL